MAKEDLSECHIRVEDPEQVADDDPHGGFQDLCLLYGDFNRPVFLEAIKWWFIRSANKQELTEIRTLVQARAEALRSGGKRGRPRGRDDEEFLRRATAVAWQRVVRGWTWARIAKEAGLKPTKPNERTVQRRMDYLAAMIWGAIPEPRIAEDPQRLKNCLGTRQIQDLLRFKVGLPFRDYPSECQKIVLALVPRGPKASFEIAKRLARTASRNRVK